MSVLGQVVLKVGQPIGGSLIYNTLQAASQPDPDMLQVKWGFMEPGFDTKILNVYSTGGEVKEWPKGTVQTEQLMDTQAGTVTYMEP